MQFRNLRLASDATVGVIIEGKFHLLQLVNVSTTGARFAMSGRAPRGTALILGYLDVGIAAQVVWSNGRQTAVRFATALSTDELIALRREASRNPSDQLARCSGKFRELT